jgi:hypothetical protein
MELVLYSAVGLCPAPRKKVSKWSEINIRKMENLVMEGRMTKAGLAIYESRDAKKKADYSYESKPQIYPNIII